MKVCIYSVEKEYLQYLNNNGDTRIPNSNNDVFGIVLEMNDYNYLVPFSSCKNELSTSFLLKKEEDILGSLRFSFMFPCPMEVLQPVDFKKIEDKKFVDLLRKEARICRRRIHKINKSAGYIYQLYLSGNIIKECCCDFQKLEELSRNYRKM